MLARHRQATHRPRAEIPRRSFRRSSMQRGTSMSRRSTPRIAPNDLRDHADEARVARVWDRIENDLSGMKEAQPHRAGIVIALIAATMAAFSGGLLVGKSMWKDRSSTELSAVASSDRSEVFDV